jgi:hypothetical protein
LWLVVILCASVILLAGCIRGFEVRVLPGATINNLVFGLAESRDGGQQVLATSIGVFRCESIRERPNGNYYPGAAEAAWYSRVIAPDGGKPTNRITYGNDEHGLQTQQGPAPLEIGGCYVVLIYGRTQQAPARSVGTAGFKVVSDGNIVEMTQREYESVFRKSG